MVIFRFIKSPLTIDKSSPAHRARELHFSFAHELHKLFDIDCTEWPIEYLPMASSRYSTVALFALLGDLDNPISASASTFADITISLSTVAKQLQLAMGMLRLVQGTALRDKMRVASEIRSIFRDSDEVVWSKIGRSSAVCIRTSRSWCRMRAWER